MAEPRAKEATGRSPGISVAVTNYNGEDYLEECLEAVRAQTLSPAEVLVVDNASTDSSRELLQRQYPEVRVVALPENRGPGVARNVALAESAHAWLLSIDNDAILAPDCLERLVRAKKRHPHASLLEPRAVYYSDRERIHYEGGYLNYLGIVSLRNHGARLAAGGALPGDSEVEEIDVTMAVALLVDRDLVTLEDGYDEEYHFYFEDIDFSYRLRLKGHRLFSVPRALVLHREGTTDLSYRKERGYPSRRAYYFTRNRWRFALKVLSFRAFVLGAPANLIYESAYLLFVAKKGHLGSYCRGLFDTCRNRKETFALRREIQRGRQISDRDLLTGKRLTFVSTDDNRGATRVLLGALNAGIQFWFRMIRPLL